VRTFCLIVLCLALALRIAAYAMDNAAEAATPAAQTEVAAQR